MSLHGIAAAERVHIGFFGLRNSGKSSLVNAVTGQNLSVVSDVSGTTTDPVRKTMELLPIGPVVIIDTPGIDDVGTLGEMRVQKTRQILNLTDIAVLVIDAVRGLSPADRELLALFTERKIPYVVALNKADLLAALQLPDECRETGIFVSALKQTGIYELKEKIGHIVRETENTKRLVGDLIRPQDLVVLVVPIDSAAPKGRLILPQQQVIRDVLESGAMAVVTRESELKQTLASLSRKPAMVITDSQAFGKVARDTPDDILLTSFSILFVRYKGDLETAIRGAARLDTLKDGDTVLISEGCTHHRQCDDIGTVKLPAWIRKYTGREIRFAFTSGTEFKEDLSPYALVIHCGACMLNEREMLSRTRHAQESGVPITNYGIAIAQMHGILKRSLSPFPELARLLEGHTTI